MIPSETYFQPEKHLPQPLVSKNLLTFESFVQAPWMTTFLSSAFFPGLGGRYGQPHALFDALQLVLSHLLLSPAYRTAHVVKSSRENYDLVIVYNWNEPFSTLYRRRPTKESETPGVSAQRQTMFPNLKPRRCLPKLCEAECELDTHALLHIRNFWHRHLIDNQRSGLSGRGEAHTTGENTYANMARRLLAAGISPKKWDRPLTDGLHQVNTEWYGNWSCVHPCPKKRQDLEEMQTCAEDWKTVDPMVCVSVGRVAMRLVDTHPGFRCWIFRSATTTKGMGTGHQSSIPCQHLQRRYQNRVRVTSSEALLLSWSCHRPRTRERRQRHQHRHRHHRAHRPP